MTSECPVAQRVAIVGAGQAGHQMAASLREQGMNGEITLIGDEPYAPYQRPPLSKTYLSSDAIDDLGADELAFRPASFFVDREISLRLNSRVEAIDRALRTLRLSDGGILAYDHLILATGARNRTLPIPGVDLDGVLQLRSLDEAFELRRRLATARCVAVIGAGFIGLECAAVAAKRGLPVTVVEAADRVMARAVTPAVSAAFQTAHERAGVTLLFDAMATEVLGRDGAVTGLRLKDGREIEADLVVVGIGVVPNAELALAAGLSAENGVLVDAQLRSSDPAISAIGDCARYPSKFAGGLVRLESVQNAVDQARCVAARLTGTPTDYAALPWFWSDQGVLKLQIAGLAIDIDQTVIRRHPTRAETFSVFCYSGGQLRAVESVNGAADHMTARQILTSGFHPTPAQAADPSIDLKALARAS